MLHACDGGIAALLFIAPLFMGGRHPLGQLVIVLLCCATACVWLARQTLLTDARWTRIGCEWILLAGLALLLLQLVPLPESLLLAISPSLARHLPLWFSHPDAQIALGVWPQVSLTPAATREGLAVYLAYALLFWVTTQRVRKLGDVERLLNWLAWAGVVMAVVGLAQFFFGNGKFLWIYEHPERTAAEPVRGPFINENHYAHLLALTVGPLLVWCRRAWSQPRHRHRSSGLFGPRSFDAAQWLRFAPAIALGLVGYAALLTFSRGGVLVMCVAAATCLTVFGRASLLSKKALVGLLATGLVVAAALAIFGRDSLVREMETLGAGSLEQLDLGQSRRLIWMADAAGFLDYPLLGTGVGSHRDVYPQYYAHYSFVEFTHAESGYVQLLLETGGAGVSLLACALVWVGMWGYRILRPPHRPDVSLCAAAIVSGLAASVVHSIWDFVWYIPACMCATIVLLACACRLSQLVVGPQPNAPPRLAPRIVWSTACLGGLLLAVMAVTECVPSSRASAAWDRYRRLSLSSRTVGRSPTELTDETLAQLMRDLDEVVGFEPHHARAHLRMARYCLTHFDRLQKGSENAIELVHIRDAALASQFPSRAAQDDWLNRVVGENRPLLDRALYHSRRAVELCPLQGEAYLYLAQLGFLEGVGEDAKPALLDQALRVRPHSGEVLVTAGSEAGLALQPEQQLAYWKEAFRQSPEVQRQLVALLGPSQPAEFFLRHLEPRPDGLQVLFEFYVAAQRLDDAAEVGQPLLVERYSAAEAARGKRAAELWHETQLVHAVLGQRTEAIECARRAVQHAPDDLRRHRVLARCLIQDEKWSEAVQELKWSVLRRPGDQELTDELTAAIRAKHKHESAIEASDDAPRNARRDPPRS